MEWRERFGEIGVLQAVLSVGDAFDLVPAPGHAAAIIRVAEAPPPGLAEKPEGPLMDDQRGGRITPTRDDFNGLERPNELQVDAKMQQNATVVGACLIALAVITACAVICHVFKV